MSATEDLTISCIGATIGTNITIGSDIINAAAGVATPSITPEDDLSVTAFATQVVTEDSDPLTRATRAPNVTTTFNIIGNVGVNPITSFRTTFSTLNSRSIDVSVSPANNFTIRTERRTATISLNSGATLPPGYEFDITIEVTSPSPLSLVSKCSPTRCGIAYRYNGIDAIVPVVGIAFGRVVAIFPEEDSSRVALSFFNGGGSPAKYITMALSQFTVFGSGLWVVRVDRTQYAEIVGNSTLEVTFPDDNLLQPGASFDVTVGRASGNAGLRQNNAFFNMTTAPTPDVPATTVESVTNQRS